MNYFTLFLFLGEALGAIGDPSVLDLLKEYSQDPVIEVEPTTCPHGQKTKLKHKKLDAKSFV